MLNELDDAYSASLGLNVSEPQPLNLFSWLCYPSMRRSPLVMLGDEWGDPMILLERYAAPEFMQCPAWVAMAELRSDDVNVMVVP